MNRQFQHLPDDDLFASWLAAEKGGNDELAETMLVALVTELPAPAARPGFADAVLERAGIAALPQRRERRAALAVGGLATLGLGAWLVALLLGQLRPALLVTALGDVFAAMGRFAAVALGWWEGAVRIGTLTRAVSVTGEATATLLALALLAVLAFAGLSLLLERSRYAGHIEA